MRSSRTVCWTSANERGFGAVKAAYFGLAVLILFSRSSNSVWSLSSSSSRSAGFFFCWSVVTTIPVNWPAISCCLSRFACLRVSRSGGTPSVISEFVSASRSSSDRARVCSVTLNASLVYSSALPSSSAPGAGEASNAMVASAVAASSKTSLVVARKVVRASSARILPSRRVSMVAMASR